MLTTAFTAYRLLKFADDMLSDKAKQQLAAHIQAASNRLAILKGAMQEPPTQEPVSKQSYEEWSYNKARR